ncbi:hypothetical protein L9Z41_16665 [Leptospira noguchii]|uniref:hypothetical protein n=1 Tax=Leptospira noguchii TaxID=28182 RepID=UPI001F0643F6|nr:hypothetical protein [Leptospira noguchii]MCH1910496.1 hypothetical protein [Leptospira noguchii]MCH1910690.1 hypothetical protein [Leptospira noguchii]MCH1911016.1 hypothetical protein [Leptospira noguchii]MCH1913722.1 hypothetical protein [Leptospira noguchii]MCH1916833.1 hypothetical protein [Leptospira noguchii]
MSLFEIVELILLYTIIGTIAGWFCIAVFGFALWFLIFKVLYKNPIRIDTGGGQPKGDDGKKNPLQEESGGAQ